MARRSRTLQRTVSFWQLVRASDGERLDHIPWPDFMAELAKRGPKIVLDVEGADLSGTLYTADETDHLVLTKDRDDLPRQQHTQTGQTADMTTTDDEWVAIESAFVSFLDFGNAFGFLQSANTAPSPQAVAKWINRTQVIEDALAAEPIIDRERWDRLKRAGGVSHLEIAARTSVLNRDEDGPLRHLFGLGQMGDLKVGITLTASRSRTPQHSDERRTLHEMTEAVVNDIGLENVDKAKVRIFDEDHEGIPAETINLIKQRFTMKRPVALLGQGAVRSVSETSAFSAILDVLGRFEADLRREVDPRRDR